MKVAVDDMQMSGNGCVPIKSYLKNRQGVGGEGGGHRLGTFAVVCPPLIQLFVEYFSNFVIIGGKLIYVFVLTSPVLL